MNSGNTDSSLIPIHRPWHFPGKSSLFSHELSCQTPQDSRICNSISIAVRIELLQAYINTYFAAVISLEQSLLVQFYAQRYEVFARSNTADRSVEYSPFKLTALLDFHSSDFWQLDSISYDADAIALVSCAVGLAMVMLGFEAGVS